MKNIKLSRLLLSVTILLGFTTLGAEVLKQGVEKNANSKKSPKVKQLSNQWSPRESDRYKATSGVYDENSWSEQKSKKEYKRGTIATH